MDLSTFIKDTFDGSPYQIRPRIVCKDGFSMSVQGHFGAYSKPRQNNIFFETLEIGFPSHKEPLISEFAENQRDLTETVYPYVDTEIIQQVIDKHGGIDVEATLIGK